MQRFFDGPADMAESLRIAKTQLLPVIDVIEAQHDPVNHVKLQTALFILFTQRAISQHGLTKKRAHEIVDALFDSFS